MGGSYITGEEEALPAGQADEGNMFVYSGNYWQFNLQTENFGGSGDYDITAVSSDQDKYLIAPSPWELSRSSRKAFGEISQ